MKNVKSVVSTILVVGAYGAAASVIAQTTQPGPAPKPGQHEAPASKGEMQGMQGMMGMMGQMDPAQMKQMMENCNKMMEHGMSRMQPPGSEPKKG